MAMRGARDDVGSALKTGGGLSAYASSSGMAQRKRAPRVPCSVGCLLLAGPGDSVSMGGAYQECGGWRCEKVRLMKTNREKEGAGLSFTGRPKSCRHTNQGRFRTEAICPPNNRPE